MTSLPSEQPREADGSILERFERLKAALVQADSFYASEAFWKGFLEEGLDEVHLAKVEGMLEACKRHDVKGQQSASRADDSIDQLLDEFDAGTIPTIQDLANEAEALGTRTGNEELLNAVRDFRSFQDEDWALAGRGDWDEAAAALIAGIKGAQQASRPDSE